MLVIYFFCDDFDILWRSITFFSTLNYEIVSLSSSLFSPVKITIFLRIIRKREDFFHDLASLFRNVAFGDYLL